METWNIDLDLTNETAQFFEEIAEEENLTVNEVISSALEDIAKYSKAHKALEEELLKLEQDTEDLGYRLEKGEKI